MTFNFIFRQGLQEHVFIKVINKHVEIVLRTISQFSDTFIKTFSWKSLTNNKVKGHIGNAYKCIGNSYKCTETYTNVSKTHTNAHHIA